MHKKNTIGLIFARGGSKGLPRKNTKLLNGKPLIAWSIEQAKAVNEIDRVIVSTDCEEIAKISIKYGAEVPFMRPSELATDDSPEWLSWQHALNFLKNENEILPDAIVSVPPTAPCRSTLDIQNAIKKFFENEIDAIITVTESNRNPWFNMVQESEDGYVDLVNKPKNTIYRRQDAKKVYDMTTVAYVLRPSFILNNNSIFSGKIKALKIPVERSLDIDSIYDFHIAEYLLKKNIGINE